jgi:Stage II sporulation protein E (SpoIIE)
VKGKEKKFLNGRSFELGGDICQAENLKFFGKSYSVFFNGEATGNSMKGATSALVIGTLLNSIMLRSVANNRVITKEPEKWLRESFFEIQKVLEPLHGTILFTCIFGVIDDETGLLQYFNAEHSMVVLYRNGSANYIKEEIISSMLGKPSNYGFALEKIQLKPNDIILCGSKSKDKLLLNPNSENERNSKVDNKSFLQLVEDSKGNLNEIYNNLIKNSEIKDDLSLVRISYLGNPN